jgi:glucose/arabinose dehydrogenase
LGSAAPAAAQSPLSSQPYVSGLTQPIAFVQDPSLPNIQYVAQQNGVVRVIEDGALRTQPFLDLSTTVLNGGEQGLLGFALAPDYPASGRFYVHFSRQTDGAHVVARFVRSTDPLQANVGSRFDLLWPAMPDIHSNCTQPEQRIICQPFGNHNGGKLAFGPDGFLYIGFGDGGSGNDPQHQAQRPRTLLGKLVRIDVNVPDSDPKGYVIPADNPFAGNDALGALDEIWAFGLRNPWQFTFDDPGLGGTGALIVGDVGQNSFEEIDYEPAASGGRNYGWRNFEGPGPNPDTTAATSMPLAFSPAMPPVHTYARETGSAVIGGYVYRGQGLNAFYQGRYFFADIVKGRIWSLALTLDSAGEATASDIREHTAGIGGGQVSAFGLDSSGELYVVYITGSIARVTSGGPCSTAAPAANWVCVSGGWVPPGHPLAGGGGTPPPPPPTPTPNAASCTTAAPAADWVCVNGGWVPPGHPLAGGGTPPAPPPTPPTPPPGPPAACTTAAPAPDWVCVSGGWVPPGHPLAGSGGGTPPPPPPTTPVACTTVQPASDWTCVNGGWLPPGFPGSSTPLPLVLPVSSSVPFDRRM